ncbi:MAG: aminodeoxychorismate synthase component I [Clostridia bacterium]|nr:aminodeoxychorismate synthase component I [Clostridia bacterium]
MIIKEIPYKDPVLLFETFRERPFSFFLDSGMNAGRLGRYSLIGSDPFLVFKSKKDLVATWQDGVWQEWRRDPFAVLRELLDCCRAVTAPSVPVPVAAGAFGYFAYDLGRQIEKLPDMAVDDLDVPDCYLGFYDRLVVFDHLAGKAYLTSTGVTGNCGLSTERAQERMKELEHLIVLPRQGNGSPKKLFEEMTTPHFTCHFTRRTYCEAVQKVKDYIAAGDIFQANLSQRFSCQLSVSPWTLYRRLRMINPAPFAAYLSYPELVIASASPERFLQVRGRQVETRPIKGTRPRGKDPAEDLRLRTELLNSAKDRAELTMIIDLERNDIGRVCTYGSVHVPELITLEEYPTVFHLVSTVRGTLAPGRDLVDLLKATFPGGSVTGAPKIRAMEIIEELEPVKRGVYTGSIGYLGFDGSADLNIVIRTFIIKGGQAYFQVGGGIVADSDPEMEYWESIHKGRALMHALGCREEVIPKCLGLPG